MVDVTNNHERANFKPTFHIAIVGAGLVGLATAIILHTAKYKVTVLEQHTELQEIGAGVQLAANSCAVLAEIGVLDKVRSRSSEPVVQAIYDQHGAVLSDQALVPDVYDAYGAPHLVIHRVDLRKILYEKAVSQGVCVRFGCKIDAKTTDWANGVLRIAENEDLRADLIVGTDGAHSMCRTALLQKPYRKRFSGKIVNRTVIDPLAMRNSGLLDLLSPPKIHNWLGPESLAIGYLLKDDFNLAVIRPADEPLFYGSRPVDANDLRAFFRDWDPRLRGLLDVGHDYQKWMLLEADDPLSEWVDPGGKLVLAGDAAHATLPYLAQGAAMGFESASVLANLLSKATTEAQIPALLRLYSSMRQSRTSHVIRASKNLGVAFTLPKGPLQAERDRALREEKPPCVGYPHVLEDPFFQSWLWGFDAKKAADEAWAKYLRVNGVRNEI